MCPFGYRVHRSTLCVFMATVYSLQFASNELTISVMRSPTASVATTNKELFPLQFTPNDIESEFDMKQNNYQNLTISIINTSTSINSNTSYENSNNNGKKERTAIHAKDIKFATRLLIIVYSSISISVLVLTMRILYVHILRKLEQPNSHITTYLRHSWSPINNWSNNYAGD